MSGWLVTQIEGENWPADSNLPTDEAELYETETKRQEANKQGVETQAVEKQAEVETQRVGVTEQIKLLKQKQIK